LQWLQDSAEAVAPLSWQVSQLQQTQPFAVSMQLQPATDTDSDHIAAVTWNSGSTLQLSSGQPTGTAGAASTAGAAAAAGAASADAADNTSGSVTEAQRAGIYAEAADTEAGCDHRQGRPPDLPESVSEAGVIGQRSSAGRARFDVAQHCSTTCSSDTARQDSNNQQSAAAPQPQSAVSSTSGRQHDSSQQAVVELAQAAASSTSARRQDRAGFRGADITQLATRGTSWSDAFRGLTAGASMDSGAMADVWQDASAASRYQMGLTQAGVTASPGRSIQARHMVPLLHVSCV